MTYKKKLIEVALPLEAINKASAREKSIRHGHPSTLHLWWARRPLAAARAVIFAQMVDDPSAHPDLFPTEKAQNKERQRLFRIIEDLVLWENTTNEEVLQQARDEIWQSWRYTCAENADHPRAKELFDRYKLPAFHDPFAGGGTLPLEAQRLGLEAYASDLNPVAVLINKAMIEIPPKFAGKPSVNPEWQSKRPEEKAMRTWKGAEGLAEDVRYYGKWMRDEAEKRIGHLYPKIEITKEIAQGRPDLEQYIGNSLTVIAWLWVRTVKSPNPAFAQVDVPLASTFMLSTKVGKETYVEPVIAKGGYRFTVKVGKPKDVAAAKSGTKLARANFFCVMSGSPISGDYIKAEGKSGRMGARMMAIVVEGVRGRIYLPATDEMEAIACQANPKWKPDILISGSTQYLGVKPYGMEQFSQLFTDRQLVVLSNFSDLVHEARERIKRDALAPLLRDDATPLNAGGTDAIAYADAVAAYLGIGVSRQANRSSTLNFWDSQGENVQQVFARQAMSMTWDFVEANPLSESTGNYMGQLGYLINALHTLPQVGSGQAIQKDATKQDISQSKVISTDPPYFDNVPYADLSDFFYVWLRRSLRPVFPDLFTTMVVPKTEELVAFAYRHVSKDAAGVFFMDGMTRAMHCLSEQAHPAFPVTIYYAFRQSETESNGTASTGWETFLEAVIQAGFATSGTWPMRTEYTGNLKTKRNALASSIILVCRKRETDAPTTTRREFVNTLKAELPIALAHLQRGNIAPVDLAQAAIGPGMAIYTRYAKVLDAEGKPMSVRDALALINQTFDDALAEQEGDFDADSRWALAWFEQFGFAEGEYGVAETLSKAKNTSVEGLVAAGFLNSKGGKVKILKPSELPEDWDPETDKRLTNWEMVHHLIRVLESGGESEAAKLVAKLGSKAETARELCYRLYTLCERKKRAAEALSYNALVQSWPEISRLAADQSKAEEPQKPQGELF
jgi:putative DNA methylase